MTQPLYGFDPLPALNPTPGTVAPAAPAPPPGIDWAGIQQREAAGQAQAIAEPEPGEDVANAERVNALREKHGWLGVTQDQTLRGALDVLLAPGALVGAAAETAGTVLRSKLLTDFGRDIGVASSGKSANEALAFVLGGADTSAADSARISLEEQEEARPMLTTLSRLAGASALSLGIGGMAGAHSGVGATMAAMGAEGAGTGAQAAYEQSAPLRDVLTSAAIGGILGAGIAGAGEAAQAGLKKAPDLARVIGEHVQEFADSRAVKSVVGRDPLAWRALTKNGKDTSRVARVADLLRAEDVIGKGDEGMLEALQKGIDRTSSDLGAIAKQLDEAGIRPKTEQLIAAWDDQIAQLRKSGSGTQAGVADAVEREVAPFREKLTRQITQRDAQGRQIVTGDTTLRDPTFQELRELKSALGRATKWHQKSQSMATDEMQKLYGATADALNDAAAQGGPQVAQLWRRTNEAASDFITVSDALGSEIARKVKNRFVSPSDYGTGIASALATAVMGGNPIAAIAAGAAASLGHKALREGGSAVLSSLANRFAKMSFRVSQRTAGGAEAQEILEALGRTRAFAAETAERAGANPAARQAAHEAASQVATEQLAKKAGPFTPSEWAKKPLSPLQKVFYRGAILDQASQDLAKVADATRALRPQLPAELDTRRIQRLLHDADGPSAIGATQSRVGQLIESLPATPAGDAAGVGLRQLSQALDVADVADTMSRAHQTAVWLDQIAQQAPDEVSKQFASRAADEIRSELASDAFGAAGRQYRSLVAAPSEMFEAFADPKAVRETLRTLHGHGQLPKALEAAAQQIAEAHDAAFKLAGQARPADLSKQIHAAEKMFHAAEQAVTIDGHRMAQLFEVGGHAGVHGGLPHGEHAPAVSPRTVVDAVEPGIEQIKPFLAPAGTANARYKPGYMRGAAAAGVLVAPKLLSEQREDYDRRMKQLAGAVADPERALKGTVQAGMGTEIGERMAQLLNDMPKPTPNVRGKAFETMSAEDLRRANAMWEATTEPMSVFADFAHGSIDYDKVKYAWKQYPGLQQAAQAGVLDMLAHDLTDDDRSAVPEAMLTQLDYLLGFGGKLQESVDPAFGARMSALYKPDPNKPKPNGMLESPAAEPTFTARLAGAI